MCADGGRRGRVGDDLADGDYLVGMEVVEKDGLVDRRTRLR